ncbi:uncharacterized protein LOC112044913 [Bicyclus anynana]|uniref:Uncharacterized protein LOC112044913 n=1 Tax=Bicyclus anynana TaxID=110368 RepID=A0A6J1MUQ2_BICAN|nr:uncharacterized protein LOC112044913 [Bicyclus anynana]
MFKLVVLTTVLAAAVANPITFWGAGLASPLASRIAAPWASPIFSPLAAQAGPLAPIGAPNYRGPLSLAPGQPANILAADGRPLDTLDVNLDRAVHYSARAVEQNGRRLQKRSIVAANLAATNLAAANLAGASLAAGSLGVAPFAAGPFAAGSLATGPLAFGPLATTGLAVTPLTAGRSWVGPAPVGLSGAASFAPLGLQAGARLVL